VQESCLPAVALIATVCTLTSKSSSIFLREDDAGRDVMAALIPMLMGSTGPWSSLITPLFAAHATSSCWNPLTDLLCLTDSLQAAKQHLSSDFYAIQPG
jgi:hypothetical protein